MHPDVLLGSDVGETHTLHRTEMNWASQRRGQKSLRLSHMWPSWAALLEVGSLPFPTANYRPAGVPSVAGPFFLISCSWDFPKYGTKLKYYSFVLCKIRHNLLGKGGGGKLFYIQSIIAPYEFLLTALADVFFPFMILIYDNIFIFSS